MAETVSTVEEQVLDALKGVRRELVRERRDRRRALATQALALVVEGLFVTAAASWIVHRASCETITKANRTTLVVLNALLDGGDKRDGVLPEKEREAAKARRDEARRVGHELLYPNACTGAR